MCRFELVLLSAEQSLRLLLLLHYSVVRTGHNLHALYKDVRKKSEGRVGIRRDIIGRMNALGRSERIDPFSEEELVACLRKHNSSYSNFRYFQLHRQARLNEKWGFSQRDIQTLHCLALALIYLNMDEMREAWHRRFVVYESGASVGNDRGIDRPTESHDLSCFRYRDIFTLISGQPRHPSQRHPEPLSRSSISYATTTMPGWCA